MIKKMLVSALTDLSYDIEERIPDKIEAILDLYANQLADLYDKRNEKFGRRKYLFKKKFYEINPDAEFISEFISEEEFESLTDKINDWYFPRFERIQKRCIKSIIKELL